MKEARLTLRIDAELRRVLEAAAAREDRTLSRLVERVLRDWAAQAKRAR